MRYLLCWWPGGRGLWRGGTLCLFVWLSGGPNTGSRRRSRRAAAGGKGGSGFEAADVPALLCVKGAFDVWGTLHIHETGPTLNLALSAVVTRLLAQVGRTLKRERLYYEYTAGSITVNGIQVRYMY
jgi:hypothetical protein